MATATRARNSGASPRTPLPATRTSPGAPLSMSAVRRRRPVRVVVGGALVLICAIVGALSVAAVDHRAPVLVVTRTIQPGETITRADLGFAHVAAAGLATTSDPAAVIGMVASGRLAAGSPIVPDELNAASRSDANSVELPMALKTGMFPPDLAAGDQVLLVPTVTTGSPVTGPAPTPVNGRVLTLVAQKSFGSTSSTTVTVAVNRADLAVLANAAASGQVLVAKAAP